MNSKSSGNTRINLWLDLAVFVAVLVAFQPHLTGLAIHEWLSLAFGGGILAHLILHWRWIVNVVRRFFQKLPLQTRLYAVLNLALLAAFAGVMVSGVLMSEIALPALGLTLAAGHAWHAIHALSANAIVALSILHVVVHAKWILNAISRTVLKPVVNLFGSPAAQPQPAPVAAQVVAQGATPRKGSGLAGWTLTLASLAWLAGMFGGWVVAALQSDSATRAATASVNAMTSDSTIQSNSVTNVQSFNPRTRSSQ